MKALSLAREIKRLGGTVEIETGNSKSYDAKLTGSLNGYDIEMHGLDSDFFTVRHEDKRGYFDAGADYNSGGYMFAHRIKDLARCCKLEVAA